MGKLIKVTLSLVLVIAVIVIMNLGSGIKATVETLGPKITQSDVSLGAAQISLMSGQGGFKGLHIGNPEGFSAEPAMSIGEISFAMNTASLGSDVIVIESLRIMAPEITLESGRGGSNLDKLQENIQSYMDGSAESSGAKSSADASVIIKDLLIKDGKLSYRLSGSPTLDLPLPELHLMNIGEPDQGVSIAQASAKIIHAISLSATKEAFKFGSPKDVGSALEDRIKAKKDRLKGLFKGLNEDG